MIKYKIGAGFGPYREKILALPERFKREGEILKYKRNVIKKMDLDDKCINVKSFKIPHLINRMAYAYLRKSKAKRSFEYAVLLSEKGINTPAPVAYIEKRSGFGFLTESYYISLHLELPTFRDLRNRKPADWAGLLRAFTRFTYDFQQKGVYFLDHSPGNTLVDRKENGEYAFYLVDLNRMKFRTLSWEEGLKNFSRLGIEAGDAAIIAGEYALLTEQKPEVAVDKLMSWVRLENEKVARKNKK